MLFAAAAAAASVLYYVLQIKKTKQFIYVIVEDIEDLSWFVYKGGRYPQVVEIEPFSQALAS